MAAHTDNAVVIHAPMDLVWSMTNDVESWPRLFHEYASVRVLAREGTTVRFRLTVHPDAYGRAATWVSERTVNPRARTVRGRRIDPGPFEYLRVHWEYAEVEDGVRMRWVHYFQMRPDARVDDATMAGLLDRGSVIQMARIKRLVEAAVGRAPTPPTLEGIPAA
jgi:aromatase